ncbi:hypothetical protein LguiA_025502 [Lonicera macranthoides]
MERENKKTGRGRDRSEDQLVKKNNGKKKRRLQNVKHNNNYNITSTDHHKDDLDVNSHHYDITRNDDDGINDDKMSGSGSVFDFPWLKKDHKKHGGSSSSNSGSMFNNDADDNYIIDHHHHPSLLKFEDCYCSSSTFAVLPIPPTFTYNSKCNYDHHYHHNIINGGDCQPRVVATATASGQSSSALPNNSDIDDPNYKYLEVKINDSNINHELELDKMEYYIWSSVLDQPLDIGLFNKYL